MTLEIISRISKGSKIDQIYIPKNRSWFETGNYVLVKPLAQNEISGRDIEKPFIYGVSKISPIKIEIIKSIFSLINKNFCPDNVIITGSFLEEGFKFNDIDILIVDEKKQDYKELKHVLEEKIGINIHILSLTSSELREGVSSDPLYENMLSKFISCKRIILNIKRKILPKLLDLHLLKSKSIIDNFDILNGSEKYYLTKNMIAISLFIESKKVSNESINKEIKNKLKVEADDIKKNMIDKESFLRWYTKEYSRVFTMILHMIKKKENKDGPK